MSKSSLTLPLLLVMCLLLCPAISGMSAYGQDIDDELLKSLESSTDKLLDRALDGDKKKQPAEEPAGDALPETTSEPLPGAIRDLAKGLLEAQKTDKPAFVLVTGEDCPWCYRLKREMQTSPAKEELARWTLIEIDVAADPAAAKRLGVAALPALRLLSPTGVKIADHDGYLSSVDLAAWLKEKLRTADAPADDLLMAAQPLTSVSVIRLVQHLGDRDPLVREAAISRLQTAPDLAAELLIEAFREGSLAKRLAILEVFDQWDAPTDGIDPWQIESIDDAKIAKLTEWNNNRKAGESSAPRPLTPEELAAAQAEIDRLLTMSPAEGAPLAARLARHAEQLLPEVYQRLRGAESDDDRERLLTLRYRLVASNALTLRFPGGLERLASKDIQIRRQAAEQLAALATAEEQPLLLELFSDSDPLIREIALRGLQQQGGDEAMQALVRLLADPEPNVRAAVLKQLAEQKTETLVEEVAKYVQTEEDPDLLVHAARYLREIPTEASARALFPLLDHASWQVRAEAAEAMRELLQEDISEDLELKADIYAGLIRLLDDDEAFVASRAVEAFSRQISDVAMEKMFAAVEKHPVLAPQIIEKLASASENSPVVAEKFRELAKAENVAVRAAAVRGLLRTSLGSMDEWGLPALQDEDSSVRQAAAVAIFASLEKKRSEVLEQRNNQLELSSSGYGASGRFPAGLEKLLGVKPNDEPKEEADTEAEQTDSEAKEQKTEADNWWDRRLTKFAAGEGRPSYYDDFIEPLNKMLSAKESDERLLAALCLTALGHAETAIPAIRQEVAQDPHRVAKVAAMLPWVPWNQRKELFAEFEQLATNSEQRGALAMALASVPDRRSSQLLWPLLKEETNDVGFANQINRALTYAYSGQRYWYRNDISPEVRAAVKADAVPRIENGSELEALVGLVLLSDVEVALAAELAGKIVDDPERPEALREDAFQIELLYAPKGERTELAKQAIANGTPRRQLLGILTLVEVDSYRLSRIRDQFYLSHSVSNSYNDSSGPIIPTAPEGVMAADVEPLLTHDDLQVRAYAGYVLATLGERKGLEPLLQYWREEGVDSSSDLNRLVYRAISKLNAGDQIETLRTIYESIDEYRLDEFYWTIRIMSGDDVLRLRKEIRDTHGVDFLR